MKNTTESQNKQILKGLMAGRRLTALGALNLYGCLRLSARIYDLRRQGHGITTERVTINEKNIAIYYLKQE